ncbi:MAG: hypothetical protein JXB50_02260 [Spirochaetes bacterium]|nr:hypothetical protein [Spirochaetota bacterium]
MTKEGFYNDIKNYIDSIYSFPTEAKVIKIYTEKGKYYLDAKELNLDGSESPVIYPKVEIPKIWGSVNGGIFCIPSKDAIVRINFKKGNKNHPYVESVLGSSFDLEHKENEFILINNTQKIHIKDNYILIQADNNFAVELDKNNGSIKLQTANETFDLSGLIELKNAAGSLKDCLDDLADLLNEVATVTSVLATSGNETNQTAVPGQFISTLNNIALAKTFIASIFK